MKEISMNIKYLFKVFSVVLVLLIIFLILFIIGLYEERMAGNFYKKFEQIKKGMSEEEVIRILGKPDKEGWENGYYYMYYDIPHLILKPQTDFWNEIHLDKKGGKVIRKYYLWSTIQSRPVEGRRRKYPFPPP